MTRVSSLRGVAFLLVIAAAVYAGAIALYLITGIGVPLVVAAMLLLPLALLVVRRRVWTPLARLEEGLQRVSEGDLTAEVPVLSGDELGRVATHFNQMTRVLRDRAEEQGRFAAAGELLAGVAHEVNNPLMAIAAHGWCARPPAISVSTRLRRPGGEPVFCCGFRARPPRLPPLSPPPPPRPRRPSGPRWDRRSRESACCWWTTRR